MFEINLVPDVKAEMIRAQKMRNLVFFMATVVSIIALGLVLLLFSIKAGQDISLNGKDAQLELMSAKLEDFDGLDELLTVQSQLANLDVIKNNKMLLSRVFTALSSLLAMPNGDEVTISSLNVNMQEGSLVFEAQADAGPTTDGIDYRVLDAFKKQVENMKYDYGRYYDKEGRVIPISCIDDTDDKGVPLTDSNGNLVANWRKGEAGCDPGRSDSLSAEISGESTADSVNRDTNRDVTQVVQIYRTPLFSEWYRSGYMDASGAIKNVEHFESACTQYSVNVSNVWETTNTCQLAPDGIEISSSSNGRDSSGGLVLRFSATIHLDSAFFGFNNAHVIAVGPKGWTNVTDSYIQISEMFSEKAMDCAEGDVTCRGSN